MSCLTLWVAVLMEIIKCFEWIRTKKMVLEGEENSEGIKNFRKVSRL